MTRDNRHARRKAARAAAREHGVGDPMADEAGADAARDIALLIEPFLHGIGFATQGAILADLTATWLAGVQGPADIVKQMRREMIAAHMKMVEEMIPINEKIMFDRIMATRKGPDQ